MLNWLWKLVKPKSPVYESTGVVTGAQVMIRYWKPVVFRPDDKNAYAAWNDVLNIARRFTPPHLVDGEQGLLRYAIALAAAADLNAVEVTWTGDPERRGVVVYRDWP